MPPAVIWKQFIGFHVYKRFRWFDWHVDVSPADREGSGSGHRKEKGRQRGDRKRPTFDEEEENPYQSGQKQDIGLLVF